MRSSGIHADEVYEVNIRGDHFEARVTGRCSWDRKRFAIQPLVPGRGFFSATPAQIVRPIREQRAA